MEKDNKKIVIIAVLLSLFTAFMIFTYIKKVESKNQNIEYVSVVVAAKNIDARNAIMPTDIKEVKIEKSLLNPMALISSTDVINRTVKDTIYEGEQILKTRLADKDNATLSFQVPEGKRAITINVNEASAVGYFINVGDCVDVIMTLEKDLQEANVPTMSKTILQNVLILGIGQEKDALKKAEQKSAKTATKTSGTQEDTTKTVTLAVTELEAEKIALSEQIGNLRLSLRRVGDNSMTTATGTTRNDLVR